MIHWKHLVAALLMLLCASPARAQQHIADPANHITFDVPAGWTVLPPEAIQKTNDNAAAMRAKANFTFIHGAAHPNGAFLLVQSSPATFQGSTWEVIERDLAPGIEAALPDLKRLAGDKLKDAAFQKPVFDKAHNRVTFPIVITNPDGSLLRGLCVMFLGSQFSAQINYYAPPDQWDAVSPDFQRITDSFAYDPGFAYDPATASNSGFNWQRNLIVGATAGILAALYALVKRKKTA